MTNLFLVHLSCTAREKSNFLTLGPSICCVYLELLTKDKCDAGTFFDSFFATQLSVLQIASAEYKHSVLLRADGYACKCSENPLQSHPFYDGIRYCISHM